MVTIPEIILHAFPAAEPGFGGNVNLSDTGNGPRISRWDEAQLGPAPAWDETSQTYPALEAFRAAAEAAQAAKLAEQEADAAERQAIRAILTALKNGTGTAAERLTRLERAVAQLIKQSLT